ncbi:unnamed protein product [Didymodactylos carnosus]|uniref:MARVEL domain-containing protein n=1 Tax=Didymodactylos carnosus TaxID=1234261 RepID=A0A814FCC2_9BILA|nr:unnamed protein product [Didymodactylos carnosus]CAF0981041.1 unnamed protein product [Didymodactylos carnosus]CAF3568077.1 unnamed protein product [Didymodactylos carnosus]CAF3753555.1 unnamed protein product [Didymodactylos carnosus]
MKIIITFKMDSMQSKLSVTHAMAYWGIFREPRGLLRLLQFVFAIFAFATAVNGTSYFVIDTGPSSPAIRADWSYPYSLGSVVVKNALSNNGTLYLSSSNGIKPSAEFFVFTGVTAFLLALAACIIYVFLDVKYRQDERLPSIDLLITVVWSIFWIAGSAGVSDIRTQTDYDTVVAQIDSCNPSANCTPVIGGSYANIIVSVIFGFLNFILWMSAVWFVYKETKWFKSRTAQRHQQYPPPPQQQSYIQEGIGNRPVPGMGDNRA